MDLCKDTWAPESESHVCSLAAHGGTAGTHQVPGGFHQLVGGEWEGLIAQVRIEHLLENGPAVSENKGGQSVSQLMLSTPGGVPWAGKALGTGQ